MKKRSEEYSADMYVPAHIGWYEVRSLVVVEYLIHSGVAHGYSGYVGESNPGHPWVKRYWNGRVWKFTDRKGRFYPADVVACAFRGLARPAS